MELPKHAAAAITARIKVLANMRLDENRLPQDGRFGAEGGGEKVSFRVSILPTYFGEKIVMRILRDSISGFTLESIGFHGTGLERMHEAMQQHDRHGPHDRPDRRRQIDDALHACSTS